MLWYLFLLWINDAGNNQPSKGGGGGVRVNHLVSTKIKNNVIIEHIFLKYYYDLKLTKKVPMYSG
jgi:hypothetical protein